MGAVLDFSTILARHQETVLYATLDKNSQIEHREKFNFLVSQDKFTLHL